MMKKNDKSEGIFDWLPNIKKVFEDFKPETKSFKVKYNKNMGEIQYKLDLGESELRRRRSRIVIPRNHNYRITDFSDETFTNIKDKIHIDYSQNSYIIKPDELPDCRYFSVKMEGTIDKNSLDNLVSITPAKNQNPTEEFDRYWLHVMIKDMSHLEKIYDFVEITDINCFVKVSIERYFKIELPPKMKKAIDLFNRWIKAGKGKDQVEVRKAWHAFRTAHIDEDSIDKFFEQVLDKVPISSYIEIDDPFYRGTVKDPENNKFIPSLIEVEAITDLTFRNPVADGFLMFRKKDFRNAIKKEFDGLED